MLYYPVLKTITLNKSWLVIRKSFYAVSLLFFAAVISFCTFYLFTDHAHLVQWYFHLNGCFYRNTTWATDFFTPGIKSGGNMYCIIAAAISLAGLYYTWGRLRIKKLLQYSVTVRLHTGNIIPVIILCLFSFGLWLWGYKAAPPAYDEVFSAQNAAGIHPFQCISYYMLPNNHLLFNFINNIFFHSFTDKVVTGRIISFLAYCAFIIFFFLWFQRIIQSRWLSLLACAALATQFFIWGFSFQARGYELYLITAWGSLIALFQYIAANEKKWLYILLLLTSAGYFIMPSMLYFHAGIIIFMLLYQLIYRKKDFLFWKYQAAAIILAFLFYLPTLCFSGLETISGNNYVKPMSHYHTAASFITGVFPIYRIYVSHIFSGIALHSFDLTWILYILPLLLLFASKNSAYFLFGLFYTILWLTAFIIIIAMKRLPFERNLIAHYSITLAALIMTVAWMIDKLTKGKNARPIKWAVLAPILLLLTWHFIKTNPALLKDTLYEYDVTYGYNVKVEQLGAIPPGSTVACSDEEFYSSYVCRKKGCIVSNCPDGNEEYYIKGASEQFASPSAGKYVLLSENTWGFQVFRKKQ